jgi:hypothetical protein
MTNDQWLDYCARSKHWNIRIGHDLLHSEAYKALSYAPGLKVLNFFFEKIKLEVIKRKRGKERFQFKNNGDISFTYREAEHRGLTHQQFRKALTELVRFGFIDVVLPGSALRGDYTKFAISERWRQYETKDFEEKKIQYSVHYRNFGFAMGKPGKKRKS